MTIASIISVVVTLGVLSLIGGVLLLLALRIFKVEKLSFGWCWLPVLIYAVVNWLMNLLLVGKINGWLLTTIAFAISWLIVVPIINSKFKTGWGKGTLAWLVWAVMYFIVGTIFSIVMAVISGIIAGITGAT